MTREWEYITVKLAATGGFVGGKFDQALLEQTLNELGAEGWELVTAFDTNMSGGQSRDIVAIFKRAR